MKVVVEFDTSADLIEYPEEIIDRIENYRNQFLAWLFNRDNEHSYWFYDDGEKLGCSYRSEAFVEWLNKFALADSINKAKVLESCVTKWDMKLVSVFF